MKTWDVRKKIIFCSLIAIEMIVCFTPLGSIPIGPIVATISMLPVIITTLTLGLVEGSIMGFLFGLFSFIVWTFFTPNPAFAFIFTPFYSSAGFSGNFWSLVVCFVPRILIALFTYASYNIFHKLMNNKLAMVFSSIIGSFTNTLLVMLFIGLFFGKQYETLMSNSILTIIITTIVVNGIPEAIVSAIICPIVSIIINKINK